MLLIERENEAHRAKHKCREIETSGEYGWKDLKTEILAGNCRDKEERRYQSTDIRLERSRKVGSQEAARGWDTNSKTISGRRGFSLQMLEGVDWVREATLGTGCSTSPWSWELSGGLPQASTHEPAILFWWLKTEAWLPGSHRS